MRLWDGPGRQYKVTIKKGLRAEHQQLRIARERERIFGMSKSFLEKGILQSSGQYTFMKECTLPQARKSCRSIDRYSWGKFPLAVLWPVPASCSQTFLPTQNSPDLQICVFQLLLNAHKCLILPCKAHPRWKIFKRCNTTGLGLTTQRSKEKEVAQRKILTSFFFKLEYSWHVASFKKFFLKIEKLYLKKEKYQIFLVLTISIS